ncbi:MAG: TIGR04283 family arsenosugar biosynthesis glycosyltransferase [Desulfomonile tiedjei]|nr:TIGR04283 family arsenosugar biosynthesis glycosyltransferase [Desulfomonile tiedjei]
MRDHSRIAVIIPALNEERSIGKVISAIPAWVDEVIVGDNGSTDRTAAVARGHGARVVYEPRRGYGSACLTALAELNNPDVVVFIDGDSSDHPEEMSLLVDPIISNEADLVIGSRTLGQREKGALPLLARFGNWLACFLIRLFWGARFTDLGPFRAIRHSALQRLDMRDPDYGWTVEMQIKAARDGLRFMEVPVSYRRRIGKSKVSGTLRGVVGAGTKILGTIFLAALGGLRTRRECEERLIIFTRYPRPGETKTRLIPALGEEGAADLHRRLTAKIVEEGRRLKRTRLVSLEIRYHGETEAEFRQWLGPDCAYSPQGEGDLGERMSSSFDEAFTAGAHRVILVGTDIPGLSHGIMEKALQELRNRDLVLGPATDGGYYLIGLRRPPNRALFEDIPWGTRTVLESTLRIAGEHGLSTALVNLLSDVDRPEDLEILSKTGTGNSQTASPDPVPGRISVIIPTLNEESSLGQCLSSINTVPDAEVLVVDGGSTDKTADVARSHGAKLLRGPTGRALQMNLGAMHATGETLLFLHADTQLPDGWTCHVLRELDKPGTAAGAFELRIQGRLPGLAFIGRLANLRSKRLHVPYGDQAIFIKAELFRRIGGFKGLPVMEDFELIRRLKKFGQIRIAPAAVTTSARRWEENGVLRTTAIHQLIIIAYMLGVPPKLLARMHSPSKYSSSRK